MLSTYTSLITGRAVIALIDHTSMILRITYFLLAFFLAMLKKITHSSTQTQIKNVRPIITSPSVLLSLRTSSRPFGQSRPSSAVTQMPKPSTSLSKARSQIFRPRARNLPPSWVTSATLPRRTLRLIRIAGGRLTNALLQNWLDCLRIWPSSQRYGFLSS